MRWIFILCAGLGSCLAKAMTVLPEEVHALLEGKKKTSRAIYLGCIHSFGRTNGLVIYNRVKECKEL